MTEELTTQLENTIIKKPTDYDRGVDPDRALATIVRILNIEPIEKADKIELATVLGWQVVVLKNQFKVGDLCIYFSIDSILDPDNPNTSFLEGKRLKTKKLLKVLSQGLVGSLDWLLYYNTEFDLNNFKEGDDVSNI